MASPALSDPNASERSRIATRPSDVQGMCPSSPEGGLGRLRRPVRRCTTGVPGREWRRHQGRVVLAGGPTPGCFAPYRAFFDPVVGRPSIPIEVYLRMMFLKFRYRLGSSRSIPWRGGRRTTTTT